MSQFPGQHDVERFMKHFGTFLNAHPYGIVLFDETDKSSEEVQEALLGALESVDFTFQKRDSRGNHESLRATVVNAQLFFATNAGESKVLESWKGESKVDEDALRTALSEELSEKFVDRMDFVELMFPADNSTYRKIVEMELRQAAERSRLEVGQFLNWDEMVTNLAERKGDQGLSNRSAARIARIMSDTASSLLRTRMVDSPEKLSHLTLRFDPTSRKIVVVPAGACHDLQLK